jgi:hypothetical protein
MAALHWGFSFTLLCHKPPSGPRPRTPTTEASVPPRATTPLPRALTLAGKVTKSFSRKFIMAEAAPPPAAPAEGAPDSETSEVEANIDRLATKLEEMYASSPTILFPPPRVSPFYFHSAWPPERSPFWHAWCTLQDLGAR